MADIQGVITLGTGPTTGSDIEHFVLVGLNANPVIAVSPAQFYVWAMMDSSFTVPAMMDGSYRLRAAMDTSHVVHADMN